MNPLTDLRQLCKSTRASEWQHTHISPGIELVSICERDGEHLNICKAYWEDEAKFIALMANTLPKFLKLIDVLEKSSFRRAVNPDPVFEWTITDHDVQAIVNAVKEIR